MSWSTCFAQVKVTHELGFKKRAQGVPRHQASGGVAQNASFKPHEARDDRRTKARVSCRLW